MRFDGFRLLQRVETTAEQKRGYVHESFSLAETVYGYVEQPRIPYAIVTLELTRFTQSLGRFTPKGSEANPEVVKGQKIAVGSLYQTD